jgi:hypothetical protein
MKENTMVRSRSLPIVIVAPMIVVGALVATALAGVLAPAYATRRGVLVWQKLNGQWKVVTEFIYYPSVGCPHAMTRCAMHTAHALTFSSPPLYNFLGNMVVRQTTTK